MFEQLFGFGVVRCKLQGALHLGTRQVRFLLLEINACEYGANQRGIASLERSLEFLDSVVELAAPMIDFGQAPVSGGVGRLGTQNTAKFVFGGIEATRGKLLASAANMRCRAVDRGHCGGIRSAARGCTLQAQRGRVQLSSYARKAEGRIEFPIHMRRLQGVRPEGLTPCSLRMWIDR